MIKLDPKTVATERGITLEEAQAYCLIAANLSNQRWRLDHLYQIVSAAGKVIPFRMNLTQKLLYLGLWFCNVVLKSRQHGITTFTCLLFLDICLFNSHTHALFIAHNKAEAENIFSKKILFAYKQLPDWLKADIGIEKESATEIVFKNGSSIRVATSGRSGTYQLVHISELGKMCKSHPLKADEVMSGTLNAIHPGNIVVVESTAEGKEGHFHDMSDTAEKAAQAKKFLSQMDYKHFFFGWYDNDLNRLDPTGVEISPRMDLYFKKIEAEVGVRLTDWQKAWYVKKEAILGEFIFNQHPSTAAEAFRVAIEGTYYWQQMADARKNGRVGSVPYNSAYVVDTWWDIGYDDPTAIWFTQTIARKIHVIDYYENSGEGLEHYRDELRKRNYAYGRHTAPHDIVQHEFTSGRERIQIAKDMGIIFDVAPRTSDATQIQLVRNVLKVCYFDSEKADEGITCLDSFRKEWNANTGTWKEKYYHDWASHGAKAFATLAIVHPLAQGSLMDVGASTPFSNEAPKPAPSPPPGGWT